MTAFRHIRFVRRQVFRKIHFVCQRRLYRHRYRGCPLAPCSPNVSVIQGEDEAEALTAVQSGERQLPELLLEQEAHLHLQAHLCVEDIRVSSATAQCPSREIRTSISFAASQTVHV